MGHCEAGAAFVDGGSSLQFQPTAHRAFRFGFASILMTARRDSRHGSLGHYCRSVFGLRWRESDDEDWHPFTPGRQHAIVTVPRLPGRGNAEYLTEADWRYLQTQFNPDNRIPLALAAVARAHELDEWGHTREALVQAVTGVELALAYFLANRDIHEAGFEQFYRELPLKSRLAVAGLCSGSISRSTLDKATVSIETRNEIIHEGHTKRDVSRELLMPLFECAKALLGLPDLKTPILYPGNGLTPPEYGGRSALVSRLSPP